MKDDTADPIRTYRNKRDFDATPEPRGKRAEAGGTLSFVVQKHHARTLHYDFRLELDGTLKSWAVPKGPSLDPQQRRMAVQVEDHPLDYASFEGTIPAGHYGAGDVIVWDRGTWTPTGDAHAGYAAGKLKFTLDGHKLHGAWTLVRMHGRENERQVPWLLIKERDAAARPESQYKLVEAEPDSVLHPKSPDSRAARSDRPPASRPAQAAKKASAPSAQSTKTASAAPPRRSKKPAELVSPANEPSAMATAPAKRAGVSPAGRTEKLAGPIRKARAAAVASTPSRSRSRSRSPTLTASPETALPGAAVPARLLPTLKPALATLVDAPPTAGRWVYEMKFDGYRLLARIEGNDVRLVTRNGHDWTQRLPELARDIRALGIDSAWIDGEIVVLGAHGAPDFQALQNVFDSTRGLKAVRYFVFDLPFFAGHDLRGAPLTERRSLLRQAISRAKPPTAISFSEDFEAQPDELLDKACRLHLEGVIGKRADSTYPSARSSAWIKLKCSRRQEFVVGGFTDPRGSRSGLGSLLLGVYDEAGTLHYAGNVGTGFDMAQLKQLRSKLDAIELEDSPFAERVPPGGVHWVEPTLVAEVAFAEWTQDGRVRQAVFKGLRTDKPASAIRREMPAAADVVASAAADASAARSSGAPTAGQSRPGSKASGKTPGAKTAPLTPTASAASRSGAAAAARIASPGIRVTHADRVVDAASGTTKGEVVAYFDAVAELLLPHLAQRPVALMRAPDGVGGETFFQKHAGPRQMPAVRRLDVKYDPGNEPLLAIDDREALLSAAQMNVLELHTWNATTRAIEKPDRMVFDLDPGEGVEWSDVAEAAELVHGLLDTLGLRNFLKTSGGRGLHVVVPLAPRDDWATVKDFSQAIVRHLAEQAGERFVAKSGPRNRVGRIFVDYLRNGRGATTVSAFSPRARPGLPVSLPLAWDELRTLTSSIAATVRTPMSRLEAARHAWPQAAGLRQTLGQAMKTMGFKKAGRATAPAG